MPRAVRYDDYGSVDNLYIAEVPEPRPSTDEVVIEVVATSINPGEAQIREGGMREQAPSTFPSGQGSDVAGRVRSVGSDVRGWGIGDEVFGWTDDRAAQADFVVVPSAQLSIKPPDVTWRQAASLYVAGGTANATVRAVAPQSGETIVVFGATGGVGTIVVQLLHAAGVRVLGVAGEAHSEWLESVGVEPITRGDGIGHRLRQAAPDGIDAAVDTHGDGYVQLAVGLGIPAHRVASIADFEADKHGAQLVIGYETTSAAVLSELAELVAAGELTIPIAATYPLDDVREAYRDLARGHTLGKIVLET